MQGETQQQKILREAGASAIKSFMMTSFFFGVGIVLVPYILPTIFEETDIRAGAQGFLLAIPYMVSVICIPLINHYMLSLGTENTILFSNIGFAVGTLFSGLAILAKVSANKVIALFTGGILTGSGLAANFTAESVLILTYSPVKDREKNIGFFRASQGFGTVLAPILISGMYTWTGYFGSFAFVTIFLLIVTPFVDNTVRATRNTFKAQLELPENDEEEIETLI